MGRQLARKDFLPPLWVITVVALGAAVWLVLALREIVTLLIVGYSVAYLIEPILKFLEKREIGRPVGVFVILAVGVLLIVLMILTALPTLVGEYSQLAENLPDYLKVARERLEPIVGSALALLPPGMTPDELLDRATEMLPSIGKETLHQVVQGVTGTLMKGYSVTLSILNLALLPFIVFYLAVDFPRLHTAVLSLFPVLRRERVKRIAAEVDLYVSAFVRGQMTIGAVLFLLYAIGLWGVGVKLWVLIAVISGFGNMVPYVGTCLGILFGSLMALVTFGDLTHLLIVWAVFGVVQFLEGTVITPRILGDKVGLSPLAVILAIVAGGTLFGLMGIFLAVPGAAALRVVLSNFHGWYIEQV
jgi:predicted PurR-regulated permease PerM